MAPAASRRQRGAFIVSLCRGQLGKDFGKILRIIINKPGKSQAFLLLCFIAKSPDSMSALSEGYSIGRTTCQRHRGQWLGSGGYRGNYQVI
jgi:hypothetical protein